MALDLSKWLVDELGMTADQVGTIATALAPHADKIEKGYLRQADYSRQSNELRTKTDALATAQQRLDQEATEWAGLTAAEKANNTALQAALEKTQQTVFALTQKVQTLAVDAGVDPATILNEVGVSAAAAVAAKQPAAQAVDTTKFVSTDVFNAVSDYMLQVQAELPMIAQEHFELTGQRLDTRAIVAEIKTRAAAKQPLDLRVIWEEKHGIPALRTTKATEKYTADLAAAEERGAQRARTEAVLPGEAPVGRHSPVLTHAASHTSKAQRPQPESGVRTAAAAFSSHKYRKTA